MIPVLGVAILNGYEHLDKMLKSIDAPVGQCVIVDNGNVVPWESPLARIIRPGHNLGVSASWNLIMKSTPKAPWWLIVNHDVEFGPGDLAAIEAAVDPKVAQITHLAGFAAFAITAPALAIVGYFDENFHPAYDEDLDYSRRCELAGVPRATIPSGIKHVGSATLFASDIYWDRNGKTHPANDAYYSFKWGGQKEGGETFETPFDRGGSVADWTLDPKRLRDQVW